MRHSSLEKYLEDFFIFFIHFLIFYQEILKQRAMEGEITIQKSIFHKISGKCI